MVQLLTGQRSIDTSPTSVASVTSLGAEVAQQAGASPGLLTGRGSTSLGGSSYLQGVLLATSQLQLPNGEKPVSQLAGAFSSAPTAGRLLFTLPEEVSAREHSVLKPSVNKMVCSGTRMLAMPVVWSITHSVAL